MLFITYNTSKKNLKTQSIILWIKKSILGSPKKKKIQISTFRSNKSFEFKFKSFELK